MTHFWGAQAIVERLGLKNVKSFYLAFAQGKAFAFKRAAPRNPCRRIWYSNSDLIGRCELAQVRLQLNQILAKKDTEDNSR